MYAVYIMTVCVGLCVWGRGVQGIVPSPSVPKLLLRPFLKIFILRQSRAPLPRLAWNMWSSCLIVLSHGAYRMCHCAQQ